MSVDSGAVVEGKVTGITRFGAFVSLPEGKSGLVHISEIANSYVSDVNEHLSVGQAVKVLVLSVNPDGKINLSIKRAQAPAPGAAERERSFQQRPAAPAGAELQPGGDKSFEDRLKKFMQESDSRIADNRIYSEHRQRSRRR